jgi:large subunit ribosomal protein L18
MRSRNKARLAKHLKIRTKISGTKDVPRLSVFKSYKHFEAQLINDKEGKTLASVSSRSMKMKYAGNKASATLVGAEMGKKIKNLKIKNIVFDRSGYIYHGRVAAFADAVRKEGVKF